MRFRAERVRKAVAELPTEQRGRTLPRVLGRVLAKRDRRAHEYPARHM